VVKQVGEKLVI